MTDEAAEVELAESDSATPSNGTDWARPSTITAAAVFMVVQLAMLRDRIPLGHDESVYLLRARYLAGGASDGAARGYWQPYRAPGLSVILSLPMRFLGEWITVSRGIVTLFGVAGVLMTGMLVSRLAGDLAGAIAPWLVVMLPGYTTYASLILLDVPGVAIAVFAAVVFERSTRDGAVSWWPGLAVPAICVAAIYVRFGTTTIIAALFIAIVVARWRQLFRAAERLVNLVRLATIGILSAGLSGLVLLMPAATGSPISPFRAQRDRQVAKEINQFSSYGEMFDLLWPNGSRPDEAATWVAIALIAVGSISALVALARPATRRLVLPGLVGCTVWVLAINYSLAEMQGNYLGLGAPVMALLVAPGLATLARSVRVLAPSRSVALVVGVVAVVATSVALTAAADRLEQQIGSSVYRSAGVELNRIAPDQECGIFTSYVQIAWYSDCILLPINAVVPGEYASPVDTDKAQFSLLDVREDQIYVAIARKGKRQPTGTELERILEDAEPVFSIEHRTRPTTVYRVVDLGAADP